MIDVLDPLDFTWGRGADVGAEQSPRPSRYRYRFVVATNHGGGVTSAPVGVEAQPLLTSANWAFTGSFEVAPNENNGSRFAYGNRCLTWYDDGSALGALIIDGHRDQTYVDASGAASGTSMKLGKASVAASKLVTPLNVGAKLQDFYDPSGPAADRNWEIALTSPVDGSIRPNKMHGGCTVYGTDILWTVTSWYDSGSAAHLTGVPAIWRRPLDLSLTTGIYGPFILSSASLNAAWWNGWMLTIPSDWRSLFGGGTHIAGHGSMSIVSRHSYGPASGYVFNADDMLTAAPGSVIAATRVWGYTDAHPANLAYPEDVGAQSPLWNGTTWVAGAYWIPGTRTIMVWGRHAYGPVSYSGSFNSTDWRMQVWFYDAMELAEVYAGDREYWDIQPYHVWNPTGMRLAEYGANATKGGSTTPHGVGYRESDKTWFVRHRKPTGYETQEISTFVGSGF